MTQIKRDFTITINILDTQNDSYLIDAEFDNKSLSADTTQLQNQQALINLADEFANWKTTPPTNETIVQVGQQLFNTIFTEDILELYHAVKTRAEHETIRLRFRLPTSLMKYPWEVLHNGENFLMLDNTMPLVRTFSNERDIPRGVVSKKLNVLFIGASTPNQASLNIEAIVDMLKTRFQEDTDRNQRIDIDIYTNQQARSEDLKRWLLDPYDVLIFMGHGGEEAIDFTSDIIYPVIYLWDDDSDDFAYGLSATELSQSLKDTSIKLVMLVACQTGNMTQFDNFAGALSQRAAVPATITMQTFIDEIAANTLIKSFLDNISSRTPAPLDVALANTRSALQQGGAPHYATAAPVLYLQSQNSDLFQRQRNYSPWIIGALSLLSLVAIIGAVFNARQVNTRADIAIDNEQQLRLQTISQRERLVEIPISNGPNHPILHDGRIWVSYQGTNAVETFNLSDTSSQNTFMTGNIPQTVIQTSENPYLWVSSANGTLTRIDPINNSSQNPIETISSPSSTLFDGDWVWHVSRDNGQLAQVNVDTLELNTVDIPRNILDPVIVGGHIWVIPPRETTLTAIDTVTRSQYTLTLDAPATELIRAGDYLWLVSDGQLIKLDATQGIILDTIEIGDAGNLHHAQDALWLNSNTSNQVLKINPDTLSLENFSFDVPIGQLYHSPNRLWITSGNNQLLMADDSNGSVIQSDIELPRANQVSGVVSDGIHLWFIVPSRGIVQAVREDDGSLYTRLVLCENVSLPIYDGTNMWFTCPQDNTLIYIPAVFFQFDIEGFEADSSEHTPVIFDDLLWLSIEDGGRIISYNGVDEVERLAPGAPLLPLQADDDYLWSAITIPGKIIRIDTSNWFNQFNVVTDILDISDEITSFSIIENNIWVQVSPTSNFERPNLYIINRNTLEIVHEHKLAIITSNITHIGEDVWVNAAGFVEGFVYRLDARTGNILEGPLDIPNTSFASWSPALIDETLWFTAGAPSMGNAGEIFAEELFGTDPDNRIGIAAYSTTINNWYDFIELPSLPSRPLVDGNILWFASFENRIPVIVREEEEIESGIIGVNITTQSLIGPYPVCEFTSGRYLQGPFMWVGCSDPETTFTLINRETQEPQIIYEDVGSRPWSPVVVGDYVWFIFRDTNNAVAFNWQTGELVQRYILGPQPAPPAIFNGDIWVYNTGDGSLQRIDSNIEQTTDP